MGGDVAMGRGECARVASGEGEDPTAPVQPRHGRYPCQARSCPGEEEEQW
jgi:hypothetical protein